MREIFVLTFKANGPHWVRSIRLNVGANIVLLLINSEVHTGKWSDSSLDVRTERSKVRIFSRMDRTNWSIRVLLYSRNQH